MKEARGDLKAIGAGEGDLSCRDLNDGDLKAILNGTLSTLEESNQKSTFGDLKPFLRVSNRVL